MFGTGLTSYVLEGDTKVTALLIHLGLRLADAEDTTSGSHASTSHAAHEEHPEGYDDKDGEQIVEYHVEELVLLTVLVGEVASEDLVLTGLVDEFLYLIYRTEFNLYVGLCPRLLGTLLEHVADMFRLYVHLDGALVLIHYDLRGKAAIHHDLEIGVGGRLGNTTVLWTATGEIE